MVVSVGKATSADYYVGDGGIVAGVESYYLDAVTDGEPAGQWTGSGAARLALDGDVVPEDMRSVYGEFVNPRTGEHIGAPRRNYRSVEERLALALEKEPDALPERVDEIRRQIERSDQTNVLGWDATFSVAKSVTVAHTAAHRAELAAIRSGDPVRAAQHRASRIAIENAIHDASDAMVGYAERIATTRAGRHGGKGATGWWEAAPELTVARFVQHTSRNIDPQLHVHHVILNRVGTADGEVRALDARDFNRQQHALGAVADRVLEERLTAAGFEFALRPDQKARELTIVPPEVCELYSSRSRQVTAKVADLVAEAEQRVGRELTDLELYRLKRAATLATRAAKTHPAETREELLSRWAAEVASEVGTQLESMADAILDHTGRPETSRASVEWSQEAILSEAVAACGEQRSTWGRSDLMLEVARRLPSLGGLDPESTVRLLDRLTDDALASELVVQVAGATDDEAVAVDQDDAGGRGPLAALETDKFSAPSSRRYATTGTLIAEEALRRAAVTRGRTAANVAQVHAWLDEHCPTIGADQRAAVAGIASSDAALTVLVGPAGTGKSYAAGAFAGAWHDTTGGTVFGLAKSEVATKVLQHDGVHASRNIDKWLASQDRLAAGSTAAEHTAWQLGPRDVVMVDEASMVGTAELARIRGLVDDAGARLVLTGDPRQLGSVDAGGVMDLLDGHAETYTLADVRRFNAAWEGPASLALRDRDLNALIEYDRHGRLLGYDSIEDAIEGAARAVVADRLAGRSVVVVTSTNETAAALSAKVRASLVELGQVEEDGVLLSLDGLTAGVGDVVACRQNDYTIGVSNREQYRITAVGADGSLMVEAADDRTRRAQPGTVSLPAGYVADHVQLGYASTVYAAEGMTVRAGHVLPDGTTDAAALYVALTRGGDRNTAHVPTGTDAPELPGGLGGHSERPTARTVLESCLERDADSRAATVEMEADQERRSSMSTLAGQREALVRAACRERMDRHLDQLAVEGVLDDDIRARLCADDGSEHLARLLRAVELAGDDPRQILRSAVEGRGLSDAKSVAQVLSHRITSEHELPVPGPMADAAPADISPAHSRALGRVARQIDERQRVLGERAASAAPRWALDAFGLPPAEANARAAWQQRAGIVAAHREATGWDDERRPIGTLPGLSATEKRASYVLAWETLGRPAAGLDEAAMSDGQLRCRVRAAEAMQAWAPPHVDESLRYAEANAETARQAAILADAAADQAAKADDHERADQLRAEAAAHRAEHATHIVVAADLGGAAEGRGRWAGVAAVTLDYGDRAKVELAERGVPWGDEPDRATTAEWFAAAEARARAEDDADRPITEADLVEDRDDTTNTASDSAPADAAEVHAVGETVARPGGRSPAHLRLPEQPTAAEVEATVAASSLAVTIANDRVSAEAAHEDEPPPDHTDLDDLDRQRRHDADEIQAIHSAAPAAETEWADE